MSLLTFRSAQGSVIMFGDDAAQLLTTLDLPTQGEISTAQLPALIDRLSSAIAVDKVQHPAVWPENDHDEADEKTTPLVIHFWQRAAPMLQLMQRCLAATETIRWPD